MKPGRASSEFNQESNAPPPPLHLQSKYDGALIILLGRHSSVTIILLSLPSLPLLLMVNSYSPTQTSPSSTTLMINIKCLYFTHMGIETLTIYHPLNDAEPLPLGELDKVHWRASPL